MLASKALSGLIPASFATSLAGALLHPLRKKSGKLRPIAVEETLHCLFAKITIQKWMVVAKASLLPQ